MKKKNHCPCDCPELKALQGRAKLLEAKAGKEEEMRSSIMEMNERLLLNTQILSHVIQNLQTRELQAHAQESGWKQTQPDSQASQAQIPFPKASYIANRYSNPYRQLPQGFPRSGQHD